ncbi:unnamed protein product [Miscanthus lutarioriparius]|uniref:Uncharacterized protein n=1 Tax=Miscanthus lutarioriparius TaxID=422564 RepID=A0A811PBK5_9POAL|nr:unnamed protein product [Miscanthus lutarioriparius]
MRPAGGCRGSGLLVLGLALSVSAALLRGCAGQQAEEDGSDAPAAATATAPMEEKERRALYAAIESFVGMGWNGSRLYPDPCGWSPIQGVSCDLFNGLWYPTVMSIGPVLDNSLRCAPDAKFSPQLFDLRRLRTLSFYSCFPASNPTAIPTAGWEKLSGTLETLEFRTNPGLTGGIPASLGRLASLQSLVLVENNLTGPVPAELGALSRLRRLVLSGNGLSGPIPAILDVDRGPEQELSNRLSAFVARWPHGAPEDGPEQQPVAGQHPAGARGAEEPHTTGPPEQQPDRRAALVRAGHGVAARPAAVEQPAVGRRAAAVRVGDAGGEPGHSGPVQRWPRGSHTGVHGGADGAPVPGAGPQPPDGRRAAPAHPAAQHRRAVPQRQQPDGGAAVLGRRFASWDNPGLCYNIAAVDVAHAPSGMVVCKDLQEPSVARDGEEGGRKPEASSSVVASSSSSGRSAARVLQGMAAAVLGLMSLLL